MGRALAPVSPRHRQGGGHARLPLWGSARVAATWGRRGWSLTLRGSLGWGSLTAGSQPLSVPQRPKVSKQSSERPPRRQWPGTAAHLAGRTLWGQAPREIPGNRGFGHRHLGQLITSEQGSELTLESGFWVQSPVLPRDTWPRADGVSSVPQFPHM